jgi:transposase
VRRSVYCTASFSVCSRRRTESPDHLRRFSPRLQTCNTAGIKTCIPARSNRSTTVPFAPRIYRRRHRVENFFEKIKSYRRVATRYDKLAETFFGFVRLAILFSLRLK